MFHFPVAIPDRKDRNERLSAKVRAETKEFDEEKDLLAKAKEAIDVLHAAENLVQKFFAKHPSLSFEDIKLAVIEKNECWGCTPTRDAFLLSVYDSLYHSLVVVSMNKQIRDKLLVVMITILSSRHYNPNGYVSLVVHDVCDESTLSCTSFSYENTHLV